MDKLHCKDDISPSLNWVVGQDHWVVDTRAFITCSMTIASRANLPIKKFGNFPVVFKISERTENITMRNVAIVPGLQYYLFSLPGTVS